MSHGDGKPSAPAHFSQNTLQAGYVRISHTCQDVSLIPQRQLGLGHAASPSVEVKAKLLGTAPRPGDLNSWSQADGNCPVKAWKPRGDPHPSREHSFTVVTTKLQWIPNPGPISGEAREVFGQTKWQQDKARQTDQGRCPGAKRFETA